MRGGRREALLVTVGNSLGILAWALFAAVGVAAVVAASASLFTTIKLIGAIVLIVLGLQGLLGRRAEAPPPPPGTALRQGWSQPGQPEAGGVLRRAVPAVRPGGRAGLPSALGMAAMVVALDLVWYSALAYGVARTRQAFVDGPWLGRVERFTGAVLVGLGVRLALERR